MLNNFKKKRGGEVFVVGVVANIFLSLTLQKYQRVPGSLPSSLRSRAGAMHTFPRSIQAGEMFTASSYTTWSDAPRLPGGSLGFGTSASWTRSLKDVGWKDKNLRALHKQK